MQKIKKLSSIEAQKIAAGEVVERPANVVKELVENSLDAGATKISVYTQEGGNTFIRIVDNGCGMNAEDARACFEHHATSKINSIDDLASIATFGFRGEALSSIASVSTIKLATKEENALHGTYLERTPEQITHQKEMPCAQGTDLSVSDLYFNVPARKKFLKKADTQWRSIVQLYQAFCLAYPAVHFQLYSDNKIAYNCPPTPELTNRMAQLFDHTVAEHMLSLEPTIKHGIRLRGIISDAHLYRYNRNQIFFFVNNRWVKNIQLFKALMKGYAHILPPERFPLAALFIECPQAEVDINVHPRKEEVVFLHPGYVETVITQSVAALLAKQVSENIRKTQSTALNTPVSNTTASTPAVHTKMSMQQISFATPGSTFMRSSIDPIIYKDHVSTKNPSLKIAPETIIQEAFETISKPSPNSIVHEQQAFFEQKPLLPAQELSVPEYKLLGIAHKTYIMLEHPEGIYFVDQHAAHECILFEQWGKRLAQTETVTLMFPEIIDIASEQVPLMEQCVPLFEQYNIGLELFGDRSVIIRSAPLHAKTINWRTFIAEFLQEMDTMNAEKASTDFFDKVGRKLRAQIACKAAVKAGDELSESQVTQLLHDLDQTEERTTCPHGRPTGWLLRLYEIEKKFKRKI